MRVRWNRVGALLIATGLIVFCSRGGLELFAQTPLSRNPDPVIVIGMFAVLAAGLVAVLRLLQE